MSISNNDVAVLLEKVADWIESRDGAAYKAYVDATNAKIATVTEALREAGVEISPALSEKLATADAELLDLLHKQAQTSGGSPDSLGGPARDLHLKTASHEEDADARLLRFLSTP